MHPEGEAPAESLRHELDASFAAVYSELRRLAHRQLARDTPGVTLSTTALVHEVYVKLAGGQLVGLRGSEHFLALAARAMRQILVDHARARRSEKRGGGFVLTQLEEGSVAVDGLGEELLAVDAALGRLEALDPRLARLVEWRFFAGLSEAEIATALGRTERTVRRDWRKARAFLFRELGGLAPGDPADAAATGD
jgi:RNA polymerase sigma factor (TIGR02999 family)